MKINYKGKEVEIQIPEPAKKIWFEKPIYNDITHGSRIGTDIRNITIEEVSEYAEEVRRSILNYWKNSQK